MSQVWEEFWLRMTAVSSLSVSIFLSKSGNLVMSLPSIASSEAYPANLAKHSFLRVSIRISTLSIIVSISKVGGTSKS